MHTLEVGYEATVEIVVEAHMQGRATQALASAAWWLSRRNILASAPYFAGVAAKMTNDLSETARAPLVAQLSQVEIASLPANTSWPLLPASISSMLAIWNPEPQEPDNATIIRIYSDAIQNVLDSKAREHQYDNIQSAITYRGDANPQFAAEADALFAWRSLVWTYSTTLLAQALADEVPVPTMQQFLADLPIFVWPGDE